MATVYIVRLLVRLRNSRLAMWAHRSIANWRLSSFLLHRSTAGKWFARGFEKLRFQIARFAFGKREQIYTIRRNTSAIRHVVQLAWRPFVGAAFVIDLMVGVPTLYDFLAPSRSWPPLPLPTIESSTYFALLGTVGPTAAGLLALFFAAISVVTSTTYAKVPADVRVLVLRDDLNSRYLQLLAHTAAVALMGVALHAVGAPPSVALAGYLVVLACISVLAFCPLVIRTCAFFGPSSMAGTPIATFDRVLRSVTRHGRRWLDPSFQNYANRIAEGQLRLLVDLVELAVSENRPGHKVLLELAGSINYLAGSYSGRKSSIPIDSLWFTRKAEFKRWDVASSSATGIALETGTTLPAESVPDHSFVETRCTAMTVKVLRQLIDRDAIDEAADLLLVINRTATKYAHFFGQAESKNLIGATRCVLINYLKAADPDVAPLKQLKLVHIQCAAALAPILSAALALTDAPIERVLHTDQPLLKLDRRRVYKEPHPRCVLKDLAELLNRLDFERSVEGMIRTQTWYVRQIIALSYAKAIRDMVAGIVNTIIEEFVEPAGDLIHATKARSAGVWLHRGIEACCKAEGRIEALDARYTELKRFHVTEALWHPLGAPEALSKVESARVKIVRMLAAIVPDLCQIQAGADLPDIVGQTRAQLAEELISMMEGKQEDGFDELFRSYFKATITVYGHFVDLAQQSGSDGYVGVAREAILDLMDLSGLAFLFSELDRTPFRLLVTPAWDAYLDGSPDKSGWLEALYAMSGSALTRLPFSPSAMQRQSWGQRLARAMADRGVDLDRHYHYPWGDRPIARHPSPIIDSINVTFGHPSQHPYDYFGALYLAERDEAQGVEIPQGIGNCIDAVERAKKRKEEAEDETPEGPADTI